MKNLENLQNKILNQTTEIEDFFENYVEVTKSEYETSFENLKILDDKNNEILKNLTGSVGEIVDALGSVDDDSGHISTKNDINKLSTLVENTSNELSQLLSNETTLITQNLTNISKNIQTFTTNFKSENTGIKEQIILIADILRSQFDDLDENSQNSFEILAKLIKEIHANTTEELDSQNEDFEDFEKSVLENVVGAIEVQSESFSAKVGKVESLLMKYAKEHDDKIDGVAFNVNLADQRVVDVDSKISDILGCLGG